MSKQTDKFLSLYKDYETTVRDAGEDPKLVEDAMDEVRGGRMRLCRQFRNYLSHSNDPGFLEPTDAMVRFMESELKERQMRGDVAKKHLKSVATSICVPKDTVTIALTNMDKLKTDKIVVYDEKVHQYKVVNIWDTSDALMKSKVTKISVVKDSKELVAFVSPTTPMSEISREALVVCTSDGTSEGKLLGLVRW